MQQGFKNCEYPWVRVELIRSTLREKGFVIKNEDRFLETYDIKEEAHRIKGLTNATLPKEKYYQRFGQTNVSTKYCNDAIDTLRAETTELLPELGPLGTIEEKYDQLLRTKQAIIEEMQDEFIKLTKEIERLKTMIAEGDAVKLP